MTTSNLPRRTVVGAVLAASLVGSGMLAFAEDAPAGPCMTFTDKAGDSAPADASAVPAPEDDLDLTGVAFDTIDGKLLLSVYVKKLNVAPEYSFGDSFSVTFKHGSKAIKAYAYRYNPTQIGTALQAAYSQTGLRVDGSTKVKDIKVTYDQKASKVLFTVPLADLDKASGIPTAGAAFSTLAAEAAGDNIAFAEPWDTATAPKDLTYAVGSACGGGAAAPAAPSVAPAPAAPAPAAAPAGSGGDPLTDYPAADCATYKDPKGDAVYNNAPNDPDLDITAYTLRTTADALVAYLKVDKLGAKPTVTPLDGHRFYSDFTFNKHVFTVAASAFSSYGSSVRENAAKSGQVGPMAAMTVDSAGTGGDPGFTDAKVTAKFDTKASIVVLSVPLASIEKYGKAPLAGATLTAVAGRAGADTGVLILPTDNTKSAKPADDVYAIGDNHCFAAPTPPLSNFGAVTAQYGDSAAVAAKLVDGAGAPVAGKTVTFTLGTSKATGTTGADGVATASLAVTEKVGQRTLTIEAEGATVSVPFTVALEKTVLRASASQGNVTATLTDDDNQPVVGQPITFTSGAKKIVTKTNAKGVAKAGFAPGSTVKVSYAGAAGMYTAAATSAKA